MKAIIQTQTGSDAKCQSQTLILLVQKEKK